LRSFFVETFGEKPLKNRIFIVALLMLALASIAVAQTSLGTITGIVKDPSGALVANAQVTITQLGTNVSRSTVTNSAGIYRFEAVLLGSYKLKVVAAGFASTEATGIAVNANQTSDYDVALKMGSTGTEVNVEAAGAAVALQTEDATRGAAIDPVQLTSLPITGQSSLNLMLIVPGVVKSNQGGSLDSGIGSVNGSRARSNNFMIDGVQNNDISVAGPSFTLTNNDAIQEVSIQTSNFTAEFGRSGGAVINQVTKSGSNSLHGTAAWVYRSERLNASNSGDRLAGTKAIFKENIPAFTVGGPITLPHFYDGRDKTFFFVGAQWDRYSDAGAATPFTVPTEAGIASLQAMAATCPNVKSYLDQLGGIRGSSGTGSQQISVELPSAIASTSCFGGARTGQTVEVGIYNRFLPRIFLDNNHIARIDHIVSQKQNMSFRWLWDSNSDTSGNVGINPSYDIPFLGKTMSGNFNDVYIFKPNLVNEFRFSYTRYNYGWFFTDPTSLGATAPDVQISGLSSLAVSATYPQGRIANSYQYQDTVGLTKGKHSIRAGVELLRQVSKQVAPFNSRGIVQYANSNEFTKKDLNGNVIASQAAMTGLANFIDNYGGSNSNPVQLTFGTGLYRPNVFTWTLFAQDTYKVSSSLTLNYGLRYENFGQPANQFKYPAFVGYGTTDITSTEKVNPDNNNLGPSVGFAWSPKFDSGLLGLLSGNGKAVLRGGYQVSYDTWYNNLLSNMAAGSPNALANLATPSTVDPTAGTPRGLGGISGILPTLVASPITPYSAQTSVFDQNIRNPYVHRISFGVQRELPSGIVADLSYVGGLGRQLFYTNTTNPGIPGTSAAKTQSTPFGNQTLRLFPNRGNIQVRSSGLTSSYNAMQLNVRRRLSSTLIGEMMVSSSYTWSKNMDTLSETFASNSSAQNPSLSPAWGIPLKDVDWGSSDNDRRQTWVTAMNWNVRGPKKGILGQIAGGWQVAPIITLQSGTPYTVVNGADRDFDATSIGDRADIGNPYQPINSFGRQVGAATCASKLQNPATGKCVTRLDVHWVQVTSLSRFSNQQRNSNFTQGLFTFDANILKTFKLTERFKFEYRAEIFNLTNNQNFNTPASATNRNVSSAGVSIPKKTNNFLNQGLNSAGNGSRTMRMGLKLMF
jgi:hypothetical protein